MGKVFGIDLGTTYSCIAYIDENGKPVVLKNSEGELTTPSVVYFESPTEITVGNVAKESSKLYPDKVVSFIKRSIGQPGFALNINSVTMSPEEISSYTLKKVVNDAMDTLRSENKLEPGEVINDVVITCPAYFGIAERDATKKAGQIAGLNVLDIINEPTAAAITYGVTDSSNRKVVLVYDLGGGTFDVTMIEIQPGSIKVICTGGDHNLGGKNWDDKVLMYLENEFKNQTGINDSVLDDKETLQEMLLSAERAKKILSSKEKSPISVNYQGERARIELTREKFDELTEDLLESTIMMTKDTLEEAEKKGYSRSDVNEILLVGGSSKMPQVMRRVKEAFNIDTKMFDPDESVAKGAAIYASKLDFFQRLVEKVAETSGRSEADVKKDIAAGKVSVENLAKKVNMDAPMRFGNDIKIINVSSRSFGTVAFDKNDRERLFNLIIKNDELPKEATDQFYTRYPDQESVKFDVLENLSSEKELDPSMGNQIGTANLSLPPNLPQGSPIQVTFRLNESGLLELYAVEMSKRQEVNAQFQTTDAITPQELKEAMDRSQNSNVS